MCVIPKHLESESQPAICQLDPAGEFSELVDGDLELIRCLGQQVLGFGWVLLELEPGQA